MVRLTGSGLGCPTWPRCSGSSFVNTPEMGVHGFIEFGNRVLGIVVGLITVAMVVLVLRYPGRPRKSLALAIGALIGVGAQGLIGGLSVRQELAPEIVAVHFLVSMVLVAALTVLVDLLRHPEVERRAPSDPRVRWTVTAVPRVLGVVLVLGTLVTGSGPHAGDRDARRFTLDSAALTTAHAIAVLALIGLQVAALVVLRAASAPTAPPSSRRTAGRVVRAGGDRCRTGRVGATGVARGRPRRERRAGRPGHHSTGGGHLAHCGVRGGYGTAARSAVISPVSAVFRAHPLRPRHSNE
ncbi:MAG: COX15/CtaA family protein [Umezawaea sp.]